MRTALILGLAFTGLATAASAQNWEAERARYESQQLNLQVQQQAQQDLDRMNAQARQQETYATVDRLRTEQTIQQLDYERYRAQQRQVAPPPATARGRAALAAQQQADAARLDALTDRFLRDSNARVRAIKPASDR